MPQSASAQRRPWLFPVVVLGAAAVAWFLVLLALDYVFAPRTLGPFLQPYAAEDVQQTLGGMPGVVVAILGIAITVVSIILQLAATRYTPRVTEMFFLDRTNLLVMGFFVVASEHCIWMAIIVRRAFVPQVMIVATALMMTAAVLILVPYFAYVFRFLDPEAIVARLRAQALAEALGRGRSPSLDARQEKVLQGVEQLADVAVNSVEQKDRIIGSRSVDALRDLVLCYIDGKPALEPGWFEIGPVLRRNPDFVAMAWESVEELSRKRTWLEWKVLRQYQWIYGESLNIMRDVAHLVAINTRYVGEKALAVHDPLVLALAIKFFNTFLRATINARDVRTAYNALNQYRLLGEAVLRHGQPEQVVEVARHFKYYGQTANASGLAFINETAAYDLAALCELAHLAKFPLERPLLEIILEVDKVPETEAQERSLRGVRKAQLKLATFYLAQGAEALARLVWRDMEHEAPERLRSIREEMLAVVDKDFWEVIDRGHNFDYLEPARREHLATFYSWFPTGAVASPGAGAGPDPVPAPAAPTPAPVPG